MQPCLPSILHSSSYHNYLPCLDAERAGKVLECTSCRLAYKNVSDNRIFISLASQSWFKAPSSHHHARLYPGNNKSGAFIRIHLAPPRLSKPSPQATRRLARRGGVKRISGLIYEEARGVLKIFLENVCTNQQSPDSARRLTCPQVIRDTVAYTEHSKRYVTLFPILFGTTVHIRIPNNQENRYRTRRALRPQAFWTYPLRLRRLKEYPCVS